jgi:hypothetical protein
MAAVKLHDLRLLPAANDVEPASGPERSPGGPEQPRLRKAGAPDWRALSALAIADVLRARGLTGGNAARWWRLSDRTARKCLAGEKPLSVEKLLAMPEGACLEALDALARLKRAA